jgi:hypothetical protein
MDELKQRLHAVQVYALRYFATISILTRDYFQEDLSCIRCVVSSFSTIPQELTHSMVCLLVPFE